jgi:hypothetical protein
VTSLPSHARARLGNRRSADGPRGDPLGTGLQAMQLSPYHAGLAGLRCLRLLCASRFAAMRWSLLPFGSGKAADLKDILRILSRFIGNTV